MNEVRCHGARGARQYIRPVAAASPLTRAILLLGDQWNLLVLQRAFADHARRFSQWRELGVSEGVLADRLAELLAEGVFELADYQSVNRLRQEYRLTEKGLALWAFLVAVWGWENRWVGERHSFPPLLHTTCGGAADPVLGCGACGVAPVSARDTTTHEASPDVITPGDRHRHHRRSSRRPDESEEQLARYHPETLDVLGNRWSVLVLGLAFLRVRRFADFRARLAIAPSLLAGRLRLFTGLGVLSVSDEGGRTRDYRLTEKGLDLFPAFACLVDWSERWEAAPGEASDLVVRHRACGERLVPVLLCRSCGEPLERTTVRPGQTSGSTSARARAESGPGVRA
jgi:DNA-binding HxlR family transcriptional regulator